MRVYVRVCDNGRVKSCGVKFFTLKHLKQYYNNDHLKCAEFSFHFQREAVTKTYFSIVL